MKLSKRLELLAYLVEKHKKGNILADLRTDFRDRDRLAESDVDVPCKAVLFDGRSGCEKTPDPGKLPIEIC